MFLITCLANRSIPGEEPFSIFKQLKLTQIFMEQSIGVDILFSLVGYSFDHLRSLLQILKKIPHNFKFY
jgi:hypothetical protein